MISSNCEEEYALTSYFLCSFCSATTRATSAVKLACQLRKMAAALSVDQSRE